ncbi:MAG TPA: LytTR family DNA-binding domain-containing protein [Methylophilaceae bacterium]|nr:LytTR family DNA-binding domain-containing protein [Methylophilaceae bacterium]
MNTQSLKIIVADDETPARNRLRELLAEIDGVCVVGEARNGKEALMLALDTGADLVLLDIRMPQMDGIEAAGHLQKVAPPPAIIFTTAFDSYAMQAFDVNAVDYLLKPIRLERLQSAIAKARALLPGQLAALQSMQRQRTHFSVTERGRVLLVPVADVIYLRAELKYLTLRTRERSYLVEDSLTAIEQEFGDHFLRLHRNCLVAQHCILGYEKRHDGDSEHGWTVLLRDVPDTLAVSRRQHHVLRKLLG